MAEKATFLFIDEAYSMVDDSNSFGDEAINTIVQEMENHRDDVIVIFEEACSHEEFGNGRFVRNL